MRRLPPPITRDLSDGRGWVVPVCAAVVSCQHPGVLLIGAEHQGCTPSRLGRLLGLNLTKCLLGHPNEADNGGNGDDPPEVGADEPDEKQDADKLPDDPRHSAML